jgi:hypothetical protein
LPAGCPFRGPGVDLRGPEAQEVFALSEAVFAWFYARDPSARVRSVSFDLSSRRVLATLSVPGMEKPMVLRVDAPDSNELFDAASAAVPRMELLAAAAVAKRAGPSP